MSGWHTVHVRVNDSSTGQPVPVRIRFEAQGRQLAPLGRCLDFPVQKGVDAGGHVELNGKRWHYIDGSCEIQLPPGEIVIEVSRGPEYRAARHVMQLAPGQISLRLTIERWIDLRKEGWYSGDTRVTDLSPHAALLEGACEDVAVVNLLAHQEAGQTGPVTNLLAFSGQQPALQRDGHMVVVNTLNQHAELGTLGLLNCHRPVFPLRAGDEGLDDWTLADWCDQCHRRKTGLVVWAENKDVIPYDCSDETVANAILGKIDALEVSIFSDPSSWEDLLLGGLRIPLVGASCKSGAGQCIGQTRTYAQLEPGQSFDYASWISAVRAGRTFVTNGPLLRLSVAGHPPGAIVRVQPDQRVHIRLEADSFVPFDSLWILSSGKVIVSGQWSPSPAIIEQEIIAATSGWINAGCLGGFIAPSGEQIFAFTSPVYLEVEGRPFLPDRGLLEWMIAEMDRMLAWTQNPPRRAANARTERLVEILTAARDVLTRRLSEV